MNRLLGASWVYSTLEIVHIAGIALLLGNLVLLEVRVFGRGAALPLAELARLALAVAVTGFGMAAWKVEPIKPGTTVGVLGFPTPKEEGEAVVRAEYLWVGGRVYGLRSSPA